MPIISPKIPQGLEELMRGLAKSVIKENPENIYEFAAEYFETLLRDRDGTVDQRYKKFATYKVYKKNKMARKQREKEIRSDAIKPSTQFDLEQGSSSKHNSDCESIEKIILPPSTQMPSKRLSVSSESEINTSVKQEAFVDDEGTPSNVNNDADDDIENMVLDEEMAQAALKIQSTFRGHKARRDIIETKALPATIKSDTEDKVESQKGSITEEILACDVSEIESEIVHNESGQQEGEIILNDAECNEVELNPNQNLLGDDVGEKNYEIIESDEHTALELKSLEEVEAFDVNSDTMKENSLEVSQEEGVIEKEMTNIHESSNEEIQTVEKYEEENFPLKLESVEIETEKPDQQNIEKDVVVDDEIANMVLDEEMEEAALKIQSAFRGHKVRKGIETVENVSTEEHVNASALDKVDSQELKIDQPLIENSEQTPETVVLEGGEPKCEVEGEQIDQESQQPEEIESEGIVNIEKEEEMLLEQIEPIDSDIIDNATNNVIELNDENLMNEVVVPSESENSEQELINEVGKSQDNELEHQLSETNDENIITEEPALITVKSNDDDGDVMKSDSEQLEAQGICDETISMEEGSDNNDCITVEFKTTDEKEALQMKEGTESIKNSTENSTIEVNDKNVEKNEEDPLAIELNDENNEKIPTESNEIEETDVPKENSENSEKVEIKSSEEILPQHSVDNNEILESNEKATGSIECNDEDLNIIATEVVEQNGSVDETVIENNDIAAEMRQASCEKEKCEIEGDEQQALATEVYEGEEVLTNDDIVKQISVEEEICEKKIITILEPEEQSKILDDEQPLDVNTVDDKLEGEVDVKASLEKMSSTEIKYEKLHESVDGKLSPTSIERQDTEDGEEEKSIDADSVIDSKHASVDVDNDQSIPPCESVEKEAIKLEKILQQSISPMDLIDEVVNEVASAKAHEMFQSTAASSIGVEEIIQPEIIKLISEEEEPKNEEEIVNDEILKPDEEESEIPEETQNPIDETLAIVEENTTDENVTEEPEIINENNDDKNPNSNEEENLDDMVLDEEMEDAAIKIQAAFRGHKSRREKTSTIKSDSKQTLDDENEKQSDNNEHYSNIVIDQCSPANEETQENDDNEQQDTSADIDEIQESEETGEQEEEQEQEEGKYLKA